LQPAHLLFGHLLAGHPVEVFGSPLEVVGGALLLLLIERLGRPLQLAAQALELPLPLHRFRALTAQPIELALAPLEEPALALVLPLLLLALALQESVHFFLAALELFAPILRPRLSGSLEGAL
jgi:hypothetical protein